MFTGKIRKARVDCNITCRQFYKVSNNKFAPVKYLFCNSALIIFAFRSSIEGTALCNNTPVNTVHKHKYVNSQQQHLYFTVLECGYDVMLLHTVEYSTPINCNTSFLPLSRQEICFCVLKHNGMKVNIIE
jgi:hypothetical protein